tara:strand:- start:251 stop:433 length:183 start_codon:yes stop_codon:yes gene_type:complete
LKALEAFKTFAEIEAARKDFASKAFPFRTCAASVASSSIAGKLAVTFTLSIVIASFAVGP